MMNYDSVLSDVVKTIEPSGIRKFFDLASDMEGVISLASRILSPPGISEMKAFTPWKKGKPTTQPMPVFWN